LAGVGNVYLFNATPNAMALILNNHVLAANVAGVQSSTSYQPSPNQVPRNSSTGNPGNATFGGTNVLIVSFPAGTSQTYDIDIDSNQVQIGNDMQLYVFFNQCVLVSPTGAGTSIVINGQASTQEHLELVKELVPPSEEGGGES